MKSNFRSQQNTPFPLAICNEHKYPVLYFNNDGFAKLEERCWCWQCKLKEPIQIEQALIQVDYLTNFSSLIMETFINFEKSVDKMMKDIKLSIEQQFSQIKAQIDHLKYQLVKIDRLLNYQKQGQQFQLQDLQQLAHLLYSKTNDKDSMEGITKTFIESQKQYQEVLLGFFKDLLNKIQSKFKQVLQDDNSQELQQIKETSDEYQQSQNNPQSKFNPKSQEFSKIESDFNPKQFKEQARFKLNGLVSCSSQLPNLQLLLGLQKDKATNDPTLELLTFSGNNMDKQKQNNDNSYSVTTIHYNENLKHILVGYQDGKIDLYDASSQLQKKFYCWEFSGSIQAIYSFKNSKSQNEFEMLCFGQIYYFKSFQVKNQNQVKELHQMKLPYQMINLIVMNDEKSIAILYQKGICFFNVNSWDQFQTIELQNPICSLKIENQIIIGSNQGQIQLLSEKYIGQYEAKTIINLESEALQLLYLADRKQIYIRQADLVSFYEYNFLNNQWDHKGMIVGKFYHIGIVKRMEKCEIALFQQEPSEIIIYG